MLYREIPPADHLKPLVLSFWEFTGPLPGEPPAEHEIFPDGCVSVLYFRNSAAGGGRLGVTQLFTESTKRWASAGDLAWGMRISPAACAAVLKADPMALRADKIQLPVEFPHLTAGLGELFDQAASLEEAIPIFETRLADLRAEPDEIVVKAVGLICAASGSIRVGELAASLGISTRQLQRRFRQAGGISPKEFARIRRIRATASVIVDGEAVNWADRAIEMGYSDQSHLAHEFSSITGHSPVRFASKVRTIRHGKIVE